MAGPWGADLVGSGEALAAKCSDLPNVEACILIMKNGKVEVVAGDGKKLRKPKKSGEPEQPPDPPGAHKTKTHDKLPPEIKGTEEEANYGATYKEHHITILGDKTCMAFNGVYYCW